MDAANCEDFDFFNTAKGPPATVEKPPLVEESKGSQIVPSDATENPEDPSINLALKETPTLNKDVEPELKTSVFDKTKILGSQEIDIEKEDSITSSQAELARLEEEEKIAAAPPKRNKKRTDPLDLVSQFYGGQKKPSINDEEPADYDQVAVQSGSAL